MVRLSVCRFICDLISNDLELLGEKMKTTTPYAIKIRCSRDKTIISQYSDQPIEYTGHEKWQVNFSDSYWRRFIVPKRSCAFANIRVC